MTQLFSPNAGLNGPLGASMPDRFRTLGTGLADATVGAIVADRKANQSVQWGLMAPGCDGLPNLNPLNDVTCCADNCPDTGSWVLLNRQHGVPTLVAAGPPARPFASTSGPPVIFRAAISDPCDLVSRVTLIDSNGNGWSIVDGSLKGTGYTPTTARPSPDPNRYESEFESLSTKLLYPPVLGATQPQIAHITINHWEKYYKPLPVQNYGFWGEGGFYTLGVSTTGATGYQMTMGNCATTGCGKVKSDVYFFGLEAPLPTGDNSAVDIPCGKYGVMVRDATAAGVDLMRPLTWTPILPGVVTGIDPGFPSGDTLTPGVDLNICACEEGSIFVHQVGMASVNLVFQYRYDVKTNKLAQIRKFSLAFGSGETAWGSTTILSAVLDAF